MSGDPGKSKRRMNVITGGVMAIALATLFMVSMFGEKTERRLTQTAQQRGVLTERQALERRRGRVADAALIGSTAP